jgi:hypothetical protein
MPSFIKDAVIDGPSPLTVFHQWDINTFVPGSDGYPLGFLLPYMQSFSMPSFRPPTLSRPSSKPARPTPKVDGPKDVAIDCPSPMTVFHPWDVNTFVPGPGGHPLPIEYTINNPKAHRLSIIDIDAMDMQMAVYVDKELRGLTTGFELDKTKNCGDNVRACGTGGFSTGFVVVGAGNHTVKIEWDGKGQCRRLYFGDLHDDALPLQNTSTVHRRWIGARNIAVGSCGGGSIALSTPMFLYCPYFSSPATSILYISSRLSYSSRLIVE